MIFRIKNPFHWEMAIQVLKLPVQVCTSAMPELVVFGGHKSNCAVNDML